MGSSTSKKMKSDEDEKKEVKDTLSEQKEAIISLEEIDELIKAKDKCIKTEFELEFEIWYNILKDHTMKTHLLQLSNEEAMAVIDNCEYTKDHNRILDENSKNILNEIIKKIDTIIAENNYTENGIFIRYSHRSPKDSVFKIDKENFAVEFKKIALQILNQDKQLKFDIKGIIINSALRGLVLAASKFQCIKSGNKAMEVTGYSHRVYRDFKIGELDHGTDFKPFMIIREFNHYLQFESEFRCFIMKNKLTVITQYHSLCYVQKLVDNKNKIKSSIVNYWRKVVHPLMKENSIESYVLDVACIKKDVDDEEKFDDYNWIVIELNPMCTNAGAALFDWRKEYELFLNGPTDFRLREQMYSMTPKALEDGLEAFQDIVTFLTQQTN